MANAKEPNDVASRIAQTLLEGFDRHYRLFRETTANAKERFEAAAWAEVERAVRERGRFYDLRVLENVERLRTEFPPDAFDDATVREAKLRYIGLLVDHKRPELAETFFNSVITRILDRTYVHNHFIFVRGAISTEYVRSDPPIYRSYYPGETGLEATLERVFLDVGWTLPFEDLARDVGFVMRAVLEHAGRDWEPPQPNFQVQVLGSPFYRNKAAYLVGKIVNGTRQFPFVIPVVHTARGELALDTILLDPNAISVLFSLSRAYFMVDMDVPSGYVHFLRTLMPAKPRSELYTAIGLGKQGKTLFVREFLHHLHHSEDLFVEAPGTRGQVMHVFNLPSFPYVFKVIKDVFGPGKATDRATVMRKFRMVKEVDRVGRMADTIEFKNLALPLDRFSPELLRQLEELAPSMVETDGADLIVRHCYAERRLVPLNLYLRDAPPEDFEHAVREYGDAIRDLAIANVFTGDLLWRNFGLNRHGRAVFYDYDEMEYLTDCVFRRIPEAPDPESELSAETWYPVGRRDVFPEEFATFVLGNPRVREVFLRHHAELLEPEFWLECQRRVAGGELVDFFPYPEPVRFRSQRERAETSSGIVSTTASARSS
jgi:isocitrate dehydrogenase kinase/phosphatase